MYSFGFRYVFSGLGFGLDLVLHPKSWFTGHGLDIACLVNIAVIL